MNSGDNLAKPPAEGRGFPFGFLEMKCRISVPRQPKIILSRDNVSASIKHFNDTILSFLTFDPHGAKQRAYFLFT